MQDKLKAFRDRQASLGRKQRTYYLTDTEFEITKSFVEDQRKPDGQRRAWVDLSVLSDDGYNRVTEAIAKTKTDPVVSDPKTTQQNPKPESQEDDEPIDFEELLAEIAKPEPETIPEDCLIGQFGFINGKKLREQPDPKPSYRERESDNRYARSEADAIDMLEAQQAFLDSTS